MSDYSDILNSKKTSDKLGDAFSKQADSMRPLNVGQRREQALLRGLGVGLNNDDERESKLAELEEDYKQVDMFDRQLKMATGKNQLTKAQNENFFLTYQNDYGVLDKLLEQGKTDEADIVLRDLFGKFNELNPDRKLGTYLGFDKASGNIFVHDNNGNAESMHYSDLTAQTIPQDQQINYPNLLTRNAKFIIDNQMALKTLDVEKARASINQSNAAAETSKTHAELYKAQSNPDAIQSEIEYKKAQTNKLNQEANNVSKGDDKKLFDEIYKTNVNYLSEAKTNIENNKKVLGAYDNIGTIVTDENADLFRRTGPSIKAAALRFLNPSFDEGTRREAELEMESQPLYLDLKKLFGFNPSNTDIALFIKTLPTMGKDYKANMNVINRRKEELKKDIFKAEETRKLIEESNYKLLHSHSSIDEIVNNRWDKKVLIDKGKVKLKLKNGSIKVYDKEKDKKAIEDILNNNLAE